MLNTLYLLGHKLYQQLSVYLQAIFYICSMLAVTQGHVGLVLVCYTHPNKEECALLIDFLIFTAHMHPDDIAIVLKDTLHAILKPSHLIKPIDQQLLRSYHPLSSAELKTFVTQEIAKTPLPDLHSNNAPGITLSANDGSKLLLKRYKNTDLAQSYNALKIYVDTLPKHDNSASNAFKLIESFGPQRHTLSNLSLQDIAGLTWHVINDPSPEVWHDPSPIAFTNRIEGYIDMLRFIAQEKNDDALHPGQHISLCFSGIYNFCLSTLDRQHVDVNIEDTLPKIALLTEIENYIKKNLSLTSTEDQCKILKALDTADPKDDTGIQWLASFNTAMYTAMREKFSSHIPLEIIYENCSVDNLQYKNFSQIYANLEKEQKGYCR